MKKYTLEEITHQITDGKHGDCTNETNSGYYFLSAKDIKNGQLNYQNARQITIDDFEETHRRTKLEAEDILITNSGTIGRMAFVKDSSLTKKTTFQKSVAIIKPNNDFIISQYLYYYLLSENRRLCSFAGGTSQKNLLLRDLRAFKVELPSFSIQQKIASILSSYDDLIENNNRRIAILEEMARRLYREWFVKFRFPGHEEVKMVDSELGEIPEGWEVVKLRDLLELAYGKALKKSERAGGDVAVYGSGGCIGYHDHSLVEGPSIIVGRKGNVGKVFWCDSDCWPIDTVFYVKSNLSKYYLYFNLKDQTFFNSDAAVPGLNREQAYNNKAILPSSIFLEQFDRFVEPLFLKIENLQKKNTNLKQQRDLLLPRLISGKTNITTAA